MHTRQMCPPCSYISHTVASQYPTQLRLFRTVCFPSADIISISLNPGRPHRPDHFNSSPGADQTPACLRDVHTVPKKKRHWRKEHQFDTAAPTAACHHPQRNPIHTRTADLAARIRLTVLDPSLYPKNSNEPPSYRFVYDQWRRSTYLDRPSASPKLLDYW